MRRKMSWTVKGIIGFIFAPMGLLFVLIGWFVGKSLNFSWEYANDSVIFQSVFCGIGGLFLIIGIALLAADLWRRHLLQRAYDGGNCVEADIIGVRAQNNVNMNGRHPCVVEAAYTDPSGVVHVYRSRYLYIDVTNLLTSKTVPVYIDRFNENIGLVDIDAVLPEIRIHS